MKLERWLLMTCTPVLLVGALAASQNAKTEEFKTKVKPLIAKYCLGCHSSKAPAAGLDLSKFNTVTEAVNSPNIWIKVHDRLSSKTMPPSGAAAPTLASTKYLINWIEANIVGKECKVKDVGRVTLRRLNRAEYNNTIRDLLGLTFEPAADFPSDDVGYGFDNNGDVLSISPLLMEKYLDAAEKIAEMAIITPTTRVSRYQQADFGVEGGASLGEDSWNLFARSQIFLLHDFRAGTYRLRIRAAATQAGDEPAKLTVLVDQKPLQTIDVNASVGKPLTYEVPLAPLAGSHKIGLAFLNDFYDPSNPDPSRRDRNLFIQELQIVGPISGGRTIPGSQRQLIPYPPEPGEEVACARKFLSAFATRAYRRPVTKDEVDRLVTCFRQAQKEGESFEKGMQLGVEAALCSPNFLFRSEVDLSSTSNHARPLTGYELASRLSYFLWSSMPDGELTKLATSGDLRRPAVLISQVQRMLKDPKISALTDNFCGQWLQLRKLAMATPDTKMFPMFSDVLRNDMIQETEMFFDAVVQDDLPITTFLDGKFTFVNDRLAALYEIPDVVGSEFRRVSLKGLPRFGVLTQASILTVTSNQTRTSPVKRGKWVLEELLGSPPPPPPPGVGGLIEETKFIAGLSLKQRMARHRTDPKCSSCHLKMDALGFGLENFDPIGRWRTVENGMPIDPSGTLPDGKRFAGPEALNRILLADSNKVVDCLSRKLLVFALGRGLEPFDDCAVDQIVKTSKKDKSRFSSVILSIVLSEPFLSKRTP